MKRLILLGASGHAKVISDIAKLNGYDDIVFLDDNPDLSGEKTEEYVNHKGDVFVAIGNSAIRRRLMDMLKQGKRNIPVLIHPSAVIGNEVMIGPGTVIMPGAVINHGAKLGEGVIINTCASVDHDCIVEDYVHVSVGTHLCGTVTVGENTWIGAGAIVSNNLSICKDSMIGAGAVVVSDIDIPGKYIGVPAKLQT